MSARTIEKLPIGQLHSWPRNARTHSRKQIRQIAESIRRFGFTNPVLIDGENRILAGHGRVEAARELSMATAPCLRVDQLVEGLAPEEAGDPADDKLSDLDGVPSRCRLGDIWRLGPHRLVCGDALDPAVVSALMDGEKAEMVFTDPPYNVAIVGNVSGLGKIRHREFAMASGEMTRDQFITFLSSGFANLASHSSDGSIHFVCMDWRHMGEMLEAGAANYSELKNLIVWVKDNGGMGAFYRSRHELIFAVKKGSLPHINRFELRQQPLHRTNVWQYRGVNTLKSGRLDELAMHPTVKPVAMIADAIKDVSRRR